MFNIQQLRAWFGAAAAAAPPPPPPPPPVSHSQLFWRRTYGSREFYVGGSYALWHFMVEMFGVAPFGWRPNDVDVFTEVKRQASAVTRYSVDDQICKWKEKLKCGLPTRVVYNKLYPHWTGDNLNDFLTDTGPRSLETEDFDGAVVAVATFEAPLGEFEGDAAFAGQQRSVVPVQVVIIDPTTVPFEATLYQKLRRIVDTPAFFTVEPGDDMTWNVSSRARDELRKLKLPRMCHRRQQKYRERGFVFG